MRQVRWSKLFRQYKFMIYYTPKKDNGRVDALSRKPDYTITGKEFFALLIKKENRIFTNVTI